MTTTLTSETITDRQIRSLRTEARAVPDGRMAALCALALDDDISDEDGCDDGHWMAIRDLSVQDARQRCADAINAARAQADR